MTGNAMIFDPNGPVAREIRMNACVVARLKSEYGQERAETCQKAAEQFILTAFD